MNPTQAHFEKSVRSKAAKLAILGHNNLLSMSGSCRNESFSGWWPFIFASAHLYILLPHKQFNLKDIALLVLTSEPFLK